VRSLGLCPSASSSEKLTSFQNHSWPETLINGIETNMEEAPDHDDVVQLISQWIQLSRESSDKKTDFLFSFVSIWIAFNALYEYYSQQSDENGKITDRKKIKNYIPMTSLQTRHRDLLQHNTDYRKSVEALAQTPVKDLSSARKSFKIEQPDNIEEVLLCVYRIRCNLFHGGKTPTVRRDRELVCNAYKVLFNLIEPASRGFRI
jgi:hypothetical protein